MSQLNEINVPLPRPSGCDGPCYSKRSPGIKSFGSHLRAGLPGPQVTYIHKHRNLVRHRYVVLRGDSVGDEVIS